jgi:hypothetical protein
MTVDKRLILAIAIYAAAVVTILHNLPLNA